MASPRIFVLAILAFDGFLRNCSGDGSSSWSCDKEILGGGFSGV